MAFRVVNEHIDYRAALLDEQKRRPKSHVGAADPAICCDSRWPDENALMIGSADRLLPTASRPDTGETPAHGKHSLKKRHGLEEMKFRRRESRGRSGADPRAEALSLRCWVSADISILKSGRQSIQCRSRCRATFAHTCHGIRTLRR
jgi:hypothetical protein